MVARVTVRLKQDVMDPQGNAILHALHSLGHKEVSAVRAGRHFDVVLNDGLTVEQARAALNTMAGELLANPIIEDFQIELPGEDRL